MTGDEIDGLENAGQIQTNLLEMKQPDLKLTDMKTTDMKMQDMFQAVKQA